MEKESRIKELDSLERELASELLEFERKVEFSKNTNDYNRLEIQEDCKIEYDIILKSLNDKTNVEIKKSELKEKSKERVKRFVDIQNNEEAMEYLNLHVRWVALKLEREYLKLI